MFQNTIRKILSHIPNVKNVSDDVLVFGKPENDHAEELKILTLNASKCAFLKKKSSRFLAWCFRVPAFALTLKRYRQSFRRELQAHHERSLLGMITYTGRFLANLADLTQPLRVLTTKTTTWNWTDRHKKALEQLKRALSDACKLTYFDPTRPTELSEYWPPWTLSHSFPVQWHTD